MDDIESNVVSLDGTVLGEAGEVFPEDEMSEAEFAIRNSLFGFIAQAIIDVNEENIEEGYIDFDAVLDAVDDHLDMLDQLTTDALASYVLLTVPTAYFYEA
jgi:hypothetical protein